MNAVALALEKLEPKQREQLAEATRKRSQSEFDVAQLFKLVTTKLLLLGAETKLVQAATTAVSDELRHAELFHKIAELYAHRSLPEPIERPVAFAPFPHLNDELRHVLHIVGLCAVGETMACSFLEATLPATTFLPLKSILPRVIGDELRHARLGWSLLGARSVCQPFGNAVAVWMPKLVASYFAAWQREIALLPAPALIEHGILEHKGAERAVYQAITDIILPGLRHCQIDPTPLTDWVSHSPRCAPFRQLNLS